MSAPSASARRWLHEEYVRKLNAAVAAGADPEALLVHWPEDVARAETLLRARIRNAVERLTAARHRPS